MHLCAESHEFPVRAVCALCTGLALWMAVAPYLPIPVMTPNALILFFPRENQTQAKLSKPSALFRSLSLCGKESSSHCIYR